MIDLSWRLEGDDTEPELTGAPRPLLGTWHYLRSSLRRRWRAWAALAMLGAVFGVLSVVLFPQPSKGSVTLLMAHPASLDGPSAISTDVSLLNTREVAARTVRQLGLATSPEAFQGAISAEPVTNEILTITVSAPDERSALRWADALTTQFLDFRGAQLRSLSGGLIGGYRSRIADMQAEVTGLNKQYSQLSDQGAEGQTQATEILTRRSQLNAQIYDMQQAIADAALSTDAAVSATHVLDAPRAMHSSTKKALALNVGSGLIGGTALGFGLIVFQALTSDRVRRRQDVALALGTPVRFSVSSSGPGNHWYARLVPGRRLAGWRRRDLQSLVHGLWSAVTAGGAGREGAGRPAAGLASVSAHGPSCTLGLVAVRNAEAAAVVLHVLAGELRMQGLSVLLVDLSQSGSLARRVPAARRQSPGRWVPWSRHQRHGRHLSSGSGPELGVLRPSGVPGLASGPRGRLLTHTLDHPRDGSIVSRWEEADVVLLLAEANPGIEAENLATWVDQVVPLVTAGRSSAEFLETTAELLRAAGLHLPFAMMVGSHETDESLGVVAPPQVPVAPAMVST